MLTDLWPHKLTPSKTLKAIFFLSNAVLFQRACNELWCRYLGVEGDTYKKERKKKKSPANCTNLTLESQALE